jgi:hypothetical protein
MKPEDHIHQRSDLTDFDDWLTEDRPTPRLAELPTLSKDKPAAG